MGSQRCKIVSSLHLVLAGTLGAIALLATSIYLASPTTHPVFGFQTPTRILKLGGFDRRDYRYLLTLGHMQSQLAIAFVYRSRLEPLQLSERQNLSLTQPGSDFKFNEFPTRPFRFRYFAGVAFSSERNLIIFPADPDDTTWDLSSGEWLKTYESKYSVDAPAWLVAVVLASYPAWFVVRLKMEHKRKRNRHEVCIQCGYNLMGNVTGVCPECGTRA
jgi:hypothetical protein